MTTALVWTLTVVSLVLGFMGLQIYYWATFVPSLGIQFLYRISRWKLVVRLLVAGSALLAFSLCPTVGQLVALAIALGLAGLTGFFYPPLALPQVDSPRHLPASEAALGDEAMVLGLNLGDKTLAWPLETLVPHHLVNDELDGQAILASW